MKKLNFLNKMSEAQRNDLIEKNYESIINAKINGLVPDNTLIYEDCNLFFKTKCFIDKKEYYFSNIKLFTKHEEYNPQRVFVIIQLQCFGDNLCANLLIQNLKKLFPYSKVVMVVDKPWVDIVKNQKDVDEVYVLDKRGAHKGIFGVFKFVSNFPYKNPDYVFQLTKNERIWMCAKLLHPRMHLIEDETIPNIKILNRHCVSLKKITNKKPDLTAPIVFNASDEIPEKLKDVIFKEKKYVAFCTTTKLEVKDLSVDIIEKTIKMINEDGEYEVLLVGSGEKPKNHAQEFIKRNCKIIDLINKTTLVELAQVLRNCKCVISADTGTMHYAYANNVPVVCVFNQNANIPYWAPDEKIYKSKTIPYPYSAQDIYLGFKELIK